MRIFVPIAVRWPAQTGVDYAYGYQDVRAEDTALAMIAAGVARDPNVIPSGGAAAAAAGGLVSTGTPTAPGLALKSKVFSDPEIAPTQPLSNWEKAKINGAQGGMLGRPAICMIVGDSTGMGTRANASAPSANTNIKAFELAAQLARACSANGLPATAACVFGTGNSSIGTTGSGAWYPAIDYRVAMGAGWTNSDVAGNNGGQGSAFNIAGGGYFVATGATAGTMDVTFQTEFDTLIVYCPHLGLASSINVLVDGTVVGTVSNATNDSGITATTFSVPAGLLAKHKISFQNTTAGINGGILGVMAWNSFAPGVVFMTNTCSGGGVSNFTATTGIAAPENTAYGVNPDLIIVDLTINDIGGALAAATWQTRMQGLVTFYNRVLGLGNPCDVILGGLSVNTNANQAALIPAYATAIQAIAAAGGPYGPLNTFDWRVVMGATGAAAQTAGTLSSDNLHPSPYGYGLRTKYILPLLLQ